MAYQIPPTIERSLLDFQPVIKGGGMQLKPIPIKVILYWIGMVFIMLYLVTQSFVQHSPLFYKILFGIWLFALIAYFGQYSKTKEMKFSMVRALVGFIPESNRKIFTRKSNKPYKFMSITNVKDIEPSGLIHFLDGTVGQVYSVVGWGSRLLFDHDRSRIISRVDRFHRKIDSSTEWIYLTLKEPQQVHKQIAQIKRRDTNLKHDTSDGALAKLLDEQYGILNYVIGGQESNYNSLHQYLIVKSKNLEALRYAHSLLVNETQSGASMFKSCVMLDNVRPDDGSAMGATERVLAHLFCNVSSSRRFVRARTR